jgi:hypothetical protein
MSGTLNSIFKAFKKQPPVREKSTEDVIAFRKLAEGGFNRTFEIIMNDGSVVIARLPYRVTYPHRLSVASEVATLRFLKLHGVPVPEVLDYSTTEINAVGVEYIIIAWRGTWRPLGFAP